jgi:hypothetical protein
MDGIQTRSRWWVELVLWMLASLAAWAAGLTLGALLTGVGSELLRLNEDRVLVYATLLSVALACGVAQSVVLRGSLPGAWRWIPVTLAGFLLAMGITAAASGARLVTGLWANAVLLALIGAAVGVPQALLLRRHFRRAGLWVLGSAAGFLSFLWLAANPTSSQGEFIVFGAILGALAAVPPGVVLAWVVRRPRDVVDGKESLT